MTPFTHKRIQSIINLYRIRTSVRIFPKGVKGMEVIYYEDLPQGVELVIGNLHIIGTQRPAPKIEKGEKEPA